MSLVLGQLPEQLLIFARVAGMLLLNPIFGRRNIPMMVRMGFVLWLSLFLLPLVSTGNIVVDDLTFILLLFKEILLGFSFAYVFQLHLLLLHFIGDLIDYQFGLSMAKVFDPGSQIQASITGNLLNWIFVLLFFLSDTHLLWIRFMKSTFDILPLDGWFNVSRLASMMMDLFIVVFALTLRLALPMVIAAFILEISMGILMRLIPQIHVFVINIQAKVLLNIFLLVLLIQPITHFLDESWGVVMNQLQNILMNL
jgi:flagellar biosynthetic protein FliR